MLLQHLGWDFSPEDLWSTLPGSARGLTVCGSCSLAEWICPIIRLGVQDCFLTAGQQGAVVLADVKATSITWHISIRVLGWSGAMSFGKGIPIWKGIFSEQLVSTGGVKCSLTVL